MSKAWLMVPVFTMALTALAGCTGESSPTPPDGTPVPAATLTTLPTPDVDRLGDGWDHGSAPAKVNLCGSNAMPPADESTAANVDAPDGHRVTISYLKVPSADSAVDAVTEAFDNCPAFLVKGGSAYAWTEVSDNARSVTGQVSYPDGSAVGLAAGVARPDVVAVVTVASTDGEFTAEGRVRLFADLVLANALAAADGATPAPVPGYESVEAPPLPE